MYNYAGIGSGAYGQVFLGENKKTKEKVAIKCMNLLKMVENG